MARSSPLVRTFLPEEIRVIRTVVWVSAITLPLAGLALLLGYPSLDVRWEHHPSHFWPVLLVAVVNTGLGFSSSETARRRGDPRIFLVGLAYGAGRGEGQARPGRRVPPRAAIRSIGSRRPRREGGRWLAAL